MNLRCLRKAEERSEATGGKPRRPSAERKEKVALARAKEKEKETVKGARGKERKEKERAKEARVIAIVVALHRLG